MSILEYKEYEEVAFLKKRPLILESSFLPPLSLHFQAPSIDCLHRHHISYLLKKIIEKCEMLGVVGSWFSRRRPVMPACLPVYLPALSVPE